jgi:iron complex transport system ATP-binding protein
MTALIDTRAVDVIAGRATLLHHVDLAVRAGETVAIVGPNGAGKSTLLRVLSGELRPHAGAVHLKGRELRAYAPHALAQHRAVLAQSITVAFPFTVAEIVRMGAGETRSRSAQAFVESALTEVGLVAFQNRIITTLSGGEQHRAHLARVLVQLDCGEREHGPGLLLLDEPTANLDLRHQVDFIALTRLRARGGTAVVAVLHDLNLAATFADRIVVLHGGSVVADGAARATITTDMLSRVFDVSAAPGEAPADGTPFILPQTMAARAGWRTGQMSGQVSPGVGSR